MCSNAQFAEMVDDLRDCEQQRLEAVRQLNLKTTSEEKLLVEIEDVKKEAQETLDAMTEFAARMEEAQETARKMEIFMEAMPTHDAFNATSVFEVWQNWRYSGIVDRMYSKILGLEHDIENLREGSN